MPSNAEVMRKYAKPSGKVLEVGVGLGDASVSILYQLEPKLLVMVDCYRQQPRDVYPDDYNVDQKTQDERMDSVLNRIFEYRDTKNGPFTDIVFRRMMSQEYIEQFADARFDAIYLDANHTYEAVKADLNGLWPMLKPLCPIFCHDYCTAVPYYGVMKAVDEFVAEHADATLVAVSEEGFPIAAIMKG